MLVQVRLIDTDGICPQVFVPLHGFVGVPEALEYIFWTDRLWERFLEHMVHMILFRPQQEIRQLTIAMRQNIYDHTSSVNDIQRTTGLAYNMAQLERQSLGYPTENGLTQSVPYDYTCPDTIVLDEFVSTVSLFACPHLALPFATLHVRRGDKGREDPFHRIHNRFRPFVHHTEAMLNAEHISPLRRDTSNIRQRPYLFEAINLVTDDLQLQTLAARWTVGDGLI